MKKTIGLVIVTIFVFMQTGVLSAETRSFSMTASVPSANGVSITAYKQAAGWLVELPSDQSLFDFGPMTFNTTNNIWMPSWELFINVSPEQGNLDTTVNYTEGNNPNGPSGKGLGWHSFALFRKSGARVIVDLPAHGKKLLKDVNNEHIAASEMTGWYSLYINIYVATGDPSEPAGAVPFTNADASGTYDGTLTITSTVL